MPDLSKLSARKLEELAEKRRARTSRATSMLIEAGYANERCGDTIKRAEATGDPLAVEFAAAVAAERPVIEEKEARRRWHGTLDPIRQKRREKPATWRH